MRITILSIFISFMIFFAAHDTSGTPSPSLSHDSAPILVCGAGHGGLLAAARLASAGHHVILFEKKEESGLGWDWHDNFLARSFRDAGMKDPNWNDFIRVNDFTFISPDGNYRITTEIPLQKREIAMDRKSLISMLVRHARESGVDIRWKSEVSGPVIEDGIVTGVIVNGAKQHGSLVIDSAGIDSPVRRGLPPSYEITNEIGRGERINVYRAYYSLNKAVPYDEREYRVYLGINGMRGIAWVRIIDGACDVLIGSIDPLDTATMETIMGKIRTENRQVGDTLIRGGTFASIPLRRPLDLFVGHNYAAIGDAAAMTVPVIGSGIENSFKAAVLLTDTVLSLGKPGSGSGIAYHRQDLWDYQYRFYRDRGARLCGLDRVKYFLLTAPWDDLNDLFRKGLLQASDLEKPLLGESIEISTGSMIKRFFRGWYRPDLLLPLKGMLDDSREIMECALAIPPRWDEKKIARWRKELNRPFITYSSALQIKNP